MRCAKTFWSNTLFTLVEGSRGGNSGDSFYSCVFVCLSVRGVATPPMFNIFTRFPSCRFFTTQGMHRMNDLEFDPKSQVQQKNKNRAISMFCRVQDKSDTTRGSLALWKEDDHGFYFIGKGQGQWPNLVEAAHLSRPLGTVWSVARVMQCNGKALTAIDLATGKAWCTIPYLI